MRGAAESEHGHRIAGRWLVAIWIGLIVVGFAVQSTNAFGSVDGEIAWMALGSLGFLLLLAFGAARLIHWLLDSGGLPGREAAPARTSPDRPPGR
jgi:hypothetical protein